jgi:hypothetical protein
MIGRFQVMATLQAARGYALGFSLAEAKSFGLNRAIFYAAAKKGFKKLKGAPPKISLPREVFKIPEKELKKIEKSFTIEKIGDEMAYCVKIKGKRVFTIGNELQTPEAFKKQIESRFGDKFKEAWKEALQIVKAYDKGVLLSQRYFYEVVYKPRRDELAKKWSEMVK